MPGTLPTTIFACACAFSGATAASATRAIAPQSALLITCPPPRSAAAAELTVFIDDLERSELLRGSFGIARIDQLIGREFLLDKPVAKIPILHVEHARHVEAAIGIARLPRKLVERDRKSTRLN